MKEFSARQQKTLAKNISAVEGRCPDQKAVAEFKEHLTDLMKMTNICELGFQIFMRIAQNGMSTLNKLTLKDNSQIEFMEKKYGINYAFSKINNIWEKKDSERTDEEKEELNDFYIAFIAEQYDPYDIDLNELILFCGHVNQLMNNVDERKDSLKYGLTSYENINKFMHDIFIIDPSTFTSLCEREVSINEFCHLHKTDSFIDPEKPKTRSLMTEEMLYQDFATESLVQRSKSVRVVLRYPVIHEHLDITNTQDQEQTQNDFLNWSKNVNKLFKVRDRYPYCVATGIRFLIEYDKEVPYRIVNCEVRGYSVNKHAKEGMKRRGFLIFSPKPRVEFFKVIKSLRQRLINVGSDVGFIPVYASKKLDDGTYDFDTDKPDNFLASFNAVIDPSCFTNIGLSSRIRTPWLRCIYENFAKPINEGKIRSPFDTIEQASAFNAYFDDEYRQSFFFKDEEHPEDIEPEQVHVYRLSNGKEFTDDDVQQCLKDHGFEKTYDFIFEKEEALLKLVGSNITDPVVWRDSCHKALENYERQLATEKNKEEMKDIDLDKYNLGQYKKDEKIKDKDKKENKSEEQETEDKKDE